MQNIPRAPITPILKELQPNKVVNASRFLEGLEGLHLFRISSKLIDSSQA